MFAFGDFIYSPKIDADNDAPYGGNGSMGLRCLAWPTFALRSLRACHSSLVRQIDWQTQQRRGFLGASTRSSSVPWFAIFCSKAVLASPSLGCTPGKGFSAIEEGEDCNRLNWWIYPCHSLRAESLRVQILGLRKTCDLLYLAWHMARYGKAIPGSIDPAWYPPR